MQNIRAYLQLVRFPAVFTAMADIMLGFVMTHHGFLPIDFFLQLLFASICLYLSGMAFNDIFDRKHADVFREYQSRLEKAGAMDFDDLLTNVVRLFREYRPPDRSYELTPHELRLLRLLMDGHNYKTAAAELGVTTHTISFHLQRIYEKLHVHSKTEAVAKALQHRLLK